MTRNFEPYKTPLSYLNPLLPEPKIAYSCFTGEIPFFPRILKLIQAILATPIDNLNITTFVFFKELFLLPDKSFFVILANPGA